MSHSWYGGDAKIKKLQDLLADADRALNMLPTYKNSSLKREITEALQKPVDTNDPATYGGEGHEQRTSKTRG